MTPALALVLLALIFIGCLLFVVWGVNSLRVPPLGP